MKTAKKYGLSDFQWAAMLFSAIVGSGVTTLPRVMADNAGRDGWISIIVGGVVVMLTASLMLALCQRFPRRTLPQFSKLILGKYLGFLVSLVYVAFALALAGMALRIFIELIKNWTLIWTPIWVILIVLLIPVVYVARMGAITLGRFSELLALLTIPALLLYFVPLGEFDLNHLRPVGAQGLRNILTVVPDATFSFLGFEIILIFFPLIINRHKAWRVTMLALLAVTGLYVFNTVLTYGVLGIEQTQNNVWPLVSYLRIGALPVLERIDNVVIFIWTGKVVAVMAVHFYSASFVIASLGGKDNHDLWSLILLPVVYVIAILPNRYIETTGFANHVGRWGFVYVAGIAAILLVVAIIRGLDDRNEEARQKSA